PAVSFPVVGIGASAGGLEAFNALLTGLPVDTGMAFVLIQHMDPRHESLLQNLLQKATAMPVIQVSDGMVVEPNHVYVIPPNTLMTISKRSLALTSRPDRLTKNLPIDHFLEALAEDLKATAIGVILSGTASDGTLGLEAIKAEGGVTFAQDEASAQYPSMPLSAVAAGCVDFILPPAAIAAELARLARHPHLRSFEPLPETGDDVLRRICVLLRTVTGVDLQLYKRTTIGRRVARRMALQKIDSFEQYMQLLLKDRAELVALCDDIFIHFTRFFRDPEALEALRRSVFSKILSSTADAIRVWIPGCSTGEEVYSIAMLLIEQLAEHSSQAKLQIFGTDIRDRAIEQARAGIYPESSMVYVSQERQRRFFSKVVGGNQIAKSLREVCVFARHDVTKDPPFSKMNLISCRNVLIYMGAVLQKRVIETFHHALKPDAFLLLGKSESLNAYAHLFSIEDPKHKIFSSIPFRAPPMAAAAAESRRAERVNAATASATVAFDLPQSAERVLLEQYTPAAVVVDPNLQIIQFQGNISPFLAPATGEPSFHLFRMVRSELVVDLRTAIRQVKRGGVAVRKEGIRFKQNGALKTVDVHVSPLKGRHPKDLDFLVVFREAAAQAPANPRRAKLTRSEVRERTKSDTARLERELAYTREQLRAIAQDHEAARAEMQAMNEEVVSGNEELQSTNEELETAKEELESSNEELNTLNEELQTRNAELSQLSDDLGNLLVGISIPIVFLDTELRIRRFTPLAGNVLNLIAADVGRPLADIAPTLQATNLGELAAQVTEHDQVVEREVRDRGGRWWGLRMRPYKTVDQKMRGILMALLDIDAVKRSLDETRDARDFAEAIVETVREPLVVLDAELRIVKATQSFYETFRVSQQDTNGKVLFNLGDGQWDVPRLRELLEHLLPLNNRFEDFEVEHNFPSIGYKCMVLNARQIHRTSSSAPMILLAIEDATDRKRADEDRVRHDSAIRDAASQAILSAGPDGKVVMINRMAEMMFGYSRDELLGQSVEMLIPESFHETHVGHRAEYFAAPRHRPRGLALNLKGRRKDGTEFPVEIDLNHIETNEGTRAIALITDLTERKQASEVIRDSQAQLAVAREIAGLGLWDWDIPTGEIRCSEEWGPLHGLAPGTMSISLDERLKFIHPDDRESFRNEFNQTLQGVKPYEAEFRVVWPDGTIHWLMARGRMVGDLEGKPIRMLGASMDITKIKLAEHDRRAVASRLAAAQADERRRIAQELHDDLTQRLAGVAMGLGGLMANPPASSRALKKGLLSLQTRAVKAAEVARHIAYQLHPSELEDLGFETSIAAHCEDFGKQERIALRFTARKLPLEIKREIAAVLYRTVQESLRNIAKHANASRASVTLEGTAGRIRLCVKDNGRGFLLKSLNASSGLGVQIMKERLQMINGTFSITSQPGRGTQVTAEVLV
ncbi:MAG TPA: chemotaxis protein CheB, partial [Bryobacteraceae bacterium]|nr:chemotaxis protein CheB [Bryobacteraceae bacterium]